MREKLNLAAAPDCRTADERLDHHRGGHHDDAQRLADTGAGIHPARRLIGRLVRESVPKGLNPGDPTRAGRRRTRLRPWTAATIRNRRRGSITRPADGRARTSGFAGVAAELNDGTLG
jgi:hypothetical protein